MSVLVSATTVAVLASASVAQAPPKAAEGSPASQSIVLVHGAFADPSAWDKVIPILQGKGYNVVVVRHPMSSLKDDVAATTRVINAQPGDVTLVGHSYGGAVITEAGNNPKVKGLVYIAAFAPDANESINDLLKGQPEPAWTKTLDKYDGGYAALPLESVKTNFAQDMPAKDIKLIHAKQGPIAMKAFDDKVTTAAWKDKSSWYVRAEQDKMIDPRAQAKMAKRIGAATVSIKASHVVMMSKPKQVAAVILEAAAPKAVSRR